MKTEPEAIGQILDLFQMLFAPESLVYASVEGTKAMGAFPGEPLGLEA